MTQAFSCWTNPPPPWILKSARLVRDEIARLKSSQRTIVICSHNLTEVEALADQIAIIYRGQDFDSRHAGMN